MVSRFPLLHGPQRKARIRMLVVMTVATIIWGGVATYALVFEPVGTTALVTLFVAFVFEASVSLVVIRADRRLRSASISQNK